jgi:hypothetical protein
MNERAGVSFIRGSTWYLDVDRSESALQDGHDKIASKEDAVKDRRETELAHNRKGVLW